MKIATYYVVFLAAISVHLAPSVTKPIRRNIVILVADGLRYGSVNPTDTPTLWAVRTRGVHFANSHSLVPTFTMGNASAIATGHYLGDTGDFSNYVYSGYELFKTGNFGKVAGTVTPFLENDQVLADMNDHYSGNYLNEATLLRLARTAGYNTAVVGKMGPTGIQEIEELAGASKEFHRMESILIDDGFGNLDEAGRTMAPPIPQHVINAIRAAGLQLKAPPRRSPSCEKGARCDNGSTGTYVVPGTSDTNWFQQRYFTDVITNAILPTFLRSAVPFVLVFWSRDPDSTQHNQGDSLNNLLPGINGETSRKAIRNVDANFKQILDFIYKNGLEDNTDVFITSDHGFATISRREIDNNGSVTSSKAAQYFYGETKPDNHWLPHGFLAIDLAREFTFNLFDPDQPVRSQEGGNAFRHVPLPVSAGFAEHPSSGNGLLGPLVVRPDASDAKIIVAANGGSDLIYIPDHDAQRVRDVVAFLSHQDYVGGIFVDDSYGRITGALPSSAIGLVGSSRLPRPAVVVFFKVFYLQPGDIQTAVQVSDTSLQQGQGMHGGLGRDSTFNSMAAIGPDFKHSFTDPAPVSNADIVPTIAQILGIQLPSVGILQGRVLVEALRGGLSSVPFEHRTEASEEASGRRTVLHYQQSAHQKYFDAACFVSSKKNCDRLSP